jgi:hypothetical protein
VGIEPVHRSAQKKNSVVSSTEARIIEDSVRRYSARRALSRCADRHREEKELFEFCDLRKNPPKDLRRVTEHPEGLSNQVA